MIQKLDASTSVKRWRFKDAKIDCLQCENFYMRCDDVKSTCNACLSIEMQSLCIYKKVRFKRNHQSQISVSEIKSVNETLISAVDRQQSRAIDTVNEKNKLHSQSIINVNRKDNKTLDDWVRHVEHKVQMKNFTLFDFILTTNSFINEKRKLESTLSIQHEDFDEWFVERHRKKKRKNNTSSWNSVLRRKTNDVVTDEINHIMNVSWN